MTPGYLDGATPAGQLVLRVFRFHEELDRAQVTQEFRRGLLLEVTRDEAWDLLKTSGDTDRIGLRFITRIGDGPSQCTEHEVSLQSLAGARMPQRGEPWAQLCGFTLIWLGK
jgi:hypothetical protein